MADFQKAAQYTLIDEGVFSDNTADPGGPTKFGVTLTLFIKWCSDNSLPFPTYQDVQNLDKPTALQIYQKYFWDFLHLDKIVDDGVATALFDIAVNIGPSKCTRFAQVACNQQLDGIMGPLTLTAINAQDKRPFMSKFVAAIIAYYNDLVNNNASQSVFLAGWCARANRLLDL